ncbi:helix-turn-helix domain containing protein [Streptomyces sp. WMMC500]|uniref:TetR/AcrR family transcriptional regulator n=1 Tax=Streptomyces sp. WMMC500 TaxID=3015154 RepID=UPI00248B3847|nr:TetR/AcrR family transcriptional regulator [Streptomyces sp. WMMC500]WBB64598.1 helix-turn-helix domain containing protein [Streptomyces sp. WMMC500]
MASVDGDLIPLEKPRPERADAARNRRLLLCTAREMIEEEGAENVTMDGLAERAGVGKGTVYRRFRTRSGIFVALLNEVESAFQQRVLSGPPPLGPGAAPMDRLIAYGRGRIAFLREHHAVARAALGPNQPIALDGSGITRPHIRFLLDRAGVGAESLDALTLQLTAALQGSAMLYLAIPDQPSDPAADSAGARYLDALAEGWEVLVARICRA